MDIVLIAAVAANGVIGRDGSLPWHLPEDLAHFKDTTMGQPVIMGRIAFDDIIDHLGEPLPGRTNIVISGSNPSLPDDVVLATDILSAIQAAQDAPGETAFVAGGATIYDQFLPSADRMILTELYQSYEGDVYFPNWDSDRWQETDRREYDEFAIVTYERTDPQE